MAIKQGAQQADIPTICESCEARQGGLCGALETGQLVNLAKASSRHEIPGGTELADDGAYSNVLSGVIKLTRNLSDGRQQIVGFHFAPDFLGRPFKAQWPITARALTKVTLCSFSKTIIERMMEETPALRRVLLKHALKQLDEARYWMAALGRKTASEKVASFLLKIARNIGPGNHSANSMSFDLPVKRADIADFLGLTIGTASRELSKLRTDGVIRIANRRHISLESVARLEERCGD
ncbi:Crp/Fnr family transcriptional regulator [Mesorhizobium sp. M4B.F.Ca.ET.089.01.1.1]|uniref:Crp/Fnr family transcriptional regulator n=1 Tax=Mesorhizobium sp. M4B.F.Ca.ET.089.01.1.1 TaxID=2496662 RepID=UPI000FE34EF0|nr:Crp/Fnr family transcriptional regulator [Mesorhizobium sp. M4B.F.Ca.ET.089.01.1.1]RWX71089.1 Crp/Fnr family transcriptional regulator [Mesorhizobium sp. M4B.F.Ca.ET.089.01.1.1]